MKKRSTSASLASICRTLCVQPSGPATFPTLCLVVALTLTFFVTVFTLLFLVPHETIGTQTSAQTTAEYAVKTAQHEHIASLPRVVPGTYIDGKTEVEAFCSQARSTDVSLCIRYEHCGRAAQDCEATCLQDKNKTTQQTCLRRCPVAYQACLTQSTS